MSWAAYGTFLVFATVLVLMPGPDFAVVTKNTLAAGRRRGLWSAVGVASSNAVQGSAAAAGLGALIVRSQPLFQTIKWLGVAYLAFLGVQAWRSAWAGRYGSADISHAEMPGHMAPGHIAPGHNRSGHVGLEQALTGWRQGFLSNITNPKVLAFYLAVLPQFVGHSSVGHPATGVALLVFALSHAVLSLLYLLLLVAALHRARQLLARRRVRRSLDAVTGAALLGFSARLATE